VELTIGDGLPDVMAFVVTKGAARAKQFHQGILGLRLVSEARPHSCYDANGMLVPVST
jgi:hypothetical protein